MQFSYSCAAVENISTDTVCHAVSVQQMMELLVSCGLKRRLVLIILHKDYSDIKQSKAGLLSHIA